MPPTTPAPPTTQSTPTTAPQTTTSSPTTTTVPATTSGAEPCQTSQLDATLGSPNGTAGTIYYQLVFRNTGSTTCTLFGYPGVSYVRGEAGTQTGDPASRNPTISGQSTPAVVTLAPGASAHAVVGEVDVEAYSSSVCKPTAVRGLRVYPPDQSTALFVPQVTKGCVATGVHQLMVGFVVS